MSTGDNNGSNPTFVIIIGFWRERGSPTNL